MYPDQQLQPHMLDVEDVEQRQKRLQTILERLNGEGSSASEPPSLSFDFGVRRTFAIEPPDALLARVQQFLPQIEQSNAELLQRDPRSIDIENIEETDGRVIEMDLGLGVFEQRRTRGHAISSSSSATSSSGSQGHETRDSSSTADSDSSSSSSSGSEDDDNGDGHSPGSRLICPLPRRARPMIQVLSSRDEEGSSTGDRPVS